MKTNFKKIVGGLVAVGSAVVAGSASAAIEMQGTMQAITESGTAVAVVGAAVLVVHVGMKVYKWIAKAL